MKSKVKTYTVAILIPLIIGGLSALITSRNMGIYSDIVTPPLSPPSVLFPIVWSILYVLMGISSAMIYLQDDYPMYKRKSALYTYALSLILNFFWSIIFFNLRAFLFSFVWLLALLFTIIRTIMKYYKINPFAAYLQIPNAIWVTFAGYLNLSIWILNK